MKRKGSLDPTQKWRTEGQALFELGKKKDAGEHVGFSGLHPARWYQPVMPGDSTMMVMDKFSSFSRDSYLLLTGMNHSQEVSEGSGKEESPTLSHTTHRKIPYDSVYEGDKMNLKA